MLRIPCPHCGLRDYTEFRYYGDASKQRPDLHDSDIKRWADYTFLFDNPKGIHQEYWQHISACRQWLVVTRDTATNTVIKADWPHEKSAQTKDLMGGQPHA